MLGLDRINLLTRGEIAALALPRVASISSDDIIFAQNQTEVKNPLSVDQSPSESTVEHALKLLREDSKTKNMGPIDVDSDDDDCDDKATLTLGHIGTFSKESVHLFRTMCTLASVTARVRDGSQKITEVYQVISVKLEMGCSNQDQNKKLSGKALVSWMLLTSVN